MYFDRDAGKAWGHHLSCPFLRGAKVPFLILGKYSRCFKKS
jgi:hypothetical protein